MLLKELLANVYDVEWPSDKGGVDIRQISCDSREDQQGALFVALSGFKSKGLDFVADVIAKGAAAVVIRDEEAALLKVNVPPQVVLIKAKDPKSSLRSLVLGFYADPSKDIRTIGITGTNGKTTFTYLMESIIHASNERCGVIGTVNYRVGKEILPAQNTTPGFIELQRFFFTLRQRAAGYCVMEVSSHALHQGRVDGINFAAAVFSNLTQDHLDYHQNFEDYFQAKALLFTRLSSNTPAVINIDDAYGQRLCHITPGKVITYGVENHADVKAVNIRYSITGTHFDMVFPNGGIAISTGFIGKHNVYNVLSAVACAYGLGFSIENIKKGVEALTDVPGRLEAVPTKKDFHVFIDYAHTEDGLINVLKALREVSNGRIITVFGCGGDRDRTKRPKMGAAVCALSDHAIITSDNPRSEDPQSIIDHITAGFTRKNYEICLDRKEAIGRAITNARKGDIILLAGKGHEDYQILKTGKIAFNERAIAEEYLGV